VSYTLKYSTGIPKGNSESKLKIKGNKMKTKISNLKLMGS
jgi:hypothetical protein